MWNWWINKTREQKEDVVCEIGAWVLLLCVCLLLGMCFGACRTVKTDVCGITEEYADSVAKDTAIEEHVIYSGYGLAEDIVIEDVLLDYLPADSCVEGGNVSVVEQILGRVKSAGKITIHRQVQQTDSIVDRKTEASETKVSQEQKEEHKEKTVKKTRSGMGWMWAGLAIAIVVTVLLKGDKMWRTLLTSLKGK